jgi:hypothetical protein
MVREEIDKYTGRLSDARRVSGTRSLSESLVFLHLRRYYGSLGLPWWHGRHGRSPAGARDDAGQVCASHGCRSRMLNVPSGEVIHISSLALLKVRVLAQ